ncbi:type II secretion system protein [Pseudoalteromonas aurantia]|uniref:Prepilin-type cleavage/methylation domain-containing protein n=1 Tax=Pseudoalteromonas aurantia TaxID=43654 RepID=A0A5S3VCR8_9GAMM|nr:type II secretion system protein [Pseudoalteromonas aurantia]TMO69997.1 hypothetical protein CWC19_03110 [Pseudoalteromonas aurantia]TMO75941.1 hypothetical protein CWC20_06710 [Pseudoalteromonas aurantia]
MMFRSSAQGFSLVELMVVLAIMGVAMTLTGGLVASVVEKQQRIVEIEKISQVFKAHSYQAYYSGYPITVKALDNNLFIKVENKPDKILSFEQLSFVEKDYKVSTRGNISPKVFYLVESINGKSDFQLPTMFRVYEK